MATIDELLKQADEYGSQATDYAKQGMTVLENANPSASTEKIRGYGDTVAGIAGEMKPYAETVSSLGTQVADIGNSVLDTAKQSAAIGTDLTNMNADSSNALVQEILRLYGEYDPNSLVAAAAQDVRSSYATGEGQLDRSMSRQGINPSSGRSAVLRQQLQTSLNTAYAAAKTRARQTGLDRQASAFQSLVVNNARNYTNDGVSQQATAGSLLANAAGLQSNAATILNNTAALFGSAASLEGSAANIDTSYASTLANQNNKLASIAQSNQSEKQSQASLLANLANSGHSYTTTFAYVGLDGNVIRPASTTRNY